MYSSNNSFGQYGAYQNNQKSNQTVHHDRYNYYNISKQAIIHQKTDNPHQNKEEKASSKITKKQSRRVIANGQFQCQCPEGFQDNAITGEVIIRNAKTRKIVYQGQFFNSQKFGYGIEYDENQNILYEGEFRAGKREGWGKTESYLGQFKEDLYDGWGKLITDRIFYQGYFSEGKYNGIGILINAQQQGFNGLQDLKKKQKIQEFLLDQISKKKNVFQQFSIDEIYIGQWTKGLRNGSGKLWKSDGYWYCGQFSYDSPHGTGAHYSAETGGVVHGVFSKGKVSKK